MTIRPALLAAAAISLLASGCAQQQPPKPRPVVAHVQPDWFHQQLAAARAARRAHQPKSDVAGAQLAYDDVMRSSCTRAALAGPGKYPTQCNAVLHPTPSQEPIDPCAVNSDDPAVQTECGD